MGEDIQLCEILLHVEMCVISTTIRIYAITIKKLYCAFLYSYTYFPILTSSNTGLFSITFVILRLFYEWDNTRWIFFTQHTALWDPFKLCVICVSVCCWIVLYFMDVPSLFIHTPLKDIWVICSFWLWKMKLLWMFM